ncbi:Rieske (2Fe-2S) protein [Martelella radicis]|uniref:3-phenylpropionate/trans-cinnamate dioxygenase ferredoxin subunit n=1 Tax=Martelella radicis TaxID=1397476 RepID=A0A7W6KMY1_9HYPH|nr:Rieske 2Fe-2S domain-containing protein [Martelella radicis]MBB4124258.1 3-phenylpropionate/trans-cinnamate dioxygenase ferredoxin subunit [Martelella radicis]
MTDHIICKVDEIPEGKAKRVEVAGRVIAIFNLGDRFAAITNTCPHEGAELCHGRVAALVNADGPGAYRTEDEKIMVRCPWHGWEFDLENGRSYCDPSRMRVKIFDVKVAHGQSLAEGPYRAEIFEVRTEDDYVVLTI